MEYEIGCHTVGIYSGEYGRLALGDGDYPEYQAYKQGHYCSRTKKAFFFTDCAENEVGVLFGYVFQFCLCAVKESLAGKSTRADCYF